MITKDKYLKIQSRLEDFKYNSLKYTEFESIKTYDILYDDENIILIYGYSSEDKLNQYHWACDRVEILLQAMHNENKDILITFIPKEWVNPLKQADFEMYAVWSEYFAESINLVDTKVDIEEIQVDEYDKVSEVTLACRGQSRGFSGQTTEWVRQWVEGREPALPSYAINSTVLVKRLNTHVIGAVCIAIYAHESEKRPILWLREIAVHPDYQRKGIARELIKQAYQYGKTVGVTRAFLMADECNEHAIHLYESMGFKGLHEEVEISMIKL